MAIILSTTCWNILPEGKVPKLGHKMNIENHINIIWEDAMLETNVSLSLNSAVLCSVVWNRVLFSSIKPHRKQLACVKVSRYIKVPLSTLWEAYGS